MMPRTALPERSILTNARNHVGRDVVINLDLKDFFPTLTYARVKGLFEALGYAEAVAIPLAPLCTEPVVDEVMLAARRLHSKRIEHARASARWIPDGLLCSTNCCARLRRPVPI